MRKKSAQLLSELAAKYPRQTVLALCRDLRVLEEAELEELVGAIIKLRPPGQPNRKRTQLPFDDTPASRIEHMLLKEAAMTAPHAAAQLKQELLLQDVRAAKIPALRGRRFGDWLTELFENVPASRVMHAALQLSRKPKTVPD
jgi:hypothetical protein